jgi:hypothetical protein
MKLPRCFVFLIQFGTHMVGLIQHSVKEFSNGEHEDNGILFEQCVCSNHYIVFMTRKLRKQSSSAQLMYHYHEI